MATPALLAPPALQSLSPTLPVRPHSHLRCHHYAFGGSEDRGRPFAAISVDEMCGPRGRQVATNAFFFRPLHRRFHPASQRHAELRGTRLRCTTAMVRSPSSLAQPSDTWPTAPVTASSTVLSKTSSAPPESSTSTPPSIPTPILPTTSSPTSPGDSIPGTFTPPPSGLQAGPTGPNGSSDQRSTRACTPRTAHGSPARPISKAQL